MLHVLQQMLCYWQWLKKDTYWNSSNVSACAGATKSIKTMMQQLQSLWPRGKGLEWGLTKLHEQIHVPAHIHRHGNHQNVHSGPQEHSHVDTKFAAKKKTQQKKLDHQTGWCVIEPLILRLCPI